jgi:hypothetical protein
VRIHVDLPAGTTIKPGAAPPGLADGPIDRVRVGLLESDRPRVVVDVDGATGLSRRADVGSDAASW